ncbi:hypothetical protein CNR22_14920 [Sphingobacteriaceae bacterium]|nr:hypothetical protein CNR22_14920 [Sphingobacteriaceae bacterium]
MQIQPLQKIKLMKTLKSLAVLFTIVLFANSCTKESTPEPTLDPAKPTPYYVRMTDAPGPYTAVNIDLQAVEITGNGNTTQLNVNAGIYNLLNFSNGLDTLIATGSLYVDKVEQIRLILGPNSTVVKGGVTYPLSTPSAEQSGLKLQVHQTLQAGVAYYVLLDFDANQSIVEKGNGSYSLKPVIRTVETAISGSIKGQLSQPGVAAIITVTSGGNSYSTVADSNGNFIIKGLPAGTYSVSAVPVSPFNTATLSNITVTVGNTTVVGILTI